MHDPVEVSHMRAALVTGPALPNGLNCLLQDVK